MRTRTRGLWIPLLALLVPAGLAGQVRVGAAAGPAILLGGGDLIDGGIGLEVHGELRLGSSPLLAKAVVGRRSLDAGESADNALVSLLGGLEAAGRFGPIEVFGELLGGTIASTGDVGDEPGAAASEWALAGGGGAGLRLWAGSAAALEVSARILRTGELTLARAPGSGGDFDESLTILGVRAGLTVELP